MKKPKPIIVALILIVVFILFTFVLGNLMDLNAVYFEKGIKPNPVIANNHSSAIL